VALGKRVQIGPNCVLKNCTIANDTVVEAFSHITDSEIGTAASIGPFARLRPGTKLAEKTKVGNFVEIKKATIARGSKVNHLSYIGDTKMGAQVNIGAGTITCNYDGANKFVTDIGDNVFIGSNTSLVAPVTLGYGATVGAGSTVSKDVGPNQLAVTRARQRNVDEWHRPEKKK
jgi:bifunctional UDP-N-acetylglucosamine pyrophosphorylase / glucosamine-1-phosphate N-acetyltransferase